ncbi:MAG: hypothetical protein M3Q23_00900 [Actinomycetota bacterium]|nr:hypothetical protein [Actinomycetota bacterium]
MDDDERQAAKLRAKAAKKHQPESIKLLLVAQTPPESLERYFYFESVTEQDALFRYVTKLILGKEPTRENKAQLLTELRNDGVFLIDLKPNPRDSAVLGSFVPDLVARCKALNPERIILIKVDVYDVAFHSLKREGLPVVDERIPFPGTGQQKNFETKFADALKRPSSQPT